MAWVKSCSKLNDSFWFPFFLLITLNQNTSVDVMFTFLKKLFFCARVCPSAAVRRAKLPNEHVPAHVPFLQSIFHRALNTTQPYGYSRGQGFGWAVGANNSSARRPTTTNTLSVVMYVCVCVLKLKLVNTEHISCQLWELEHLNCISIHYRWSRTHVVGALRLCNITWHLGGGTKSYLEPVWSVYCPNWYNHIWC